MSQTDELFDGLILQVYQQLLTANHQLRGANTLKRISLKSYGWEEAL